MHAPTIYRLLAAVALVAACTNAQKLQVYILAGQSNMQGHAKVATLDYLADDPTTAGLLAKIRDDQGTPRVFDDVWVSYLTNGRDGDGEGLGQLTTGFGARGDAADPGDKIGPELTFGITVAEAHRGPVLLIKTAWGGKSLHTDFRPPSAGAYEFRDDQIERMRSQGKDVDAIRQAKADATGDYYRRMIAHVRRVLDDPARVCAAYDPTQGYELAGFVWFQGWNDMVDSDTYPKRDKPGGYDAYSECLAHFIRDVRSDLSAPDLPFVIGIMGVNGTLDPAGRHTPVHTNFRNAMAAPAAMPEFRGTVAAVPTAPYWDAKLQTIADALADVQDMGRKLRNKDKSGPNKDGSMDDAAQKQWLADYRQKVVGPENEAIWERGASNAAFHYLGCAKTMAGIGVAFAEAALAMRK